MSKHDSIYVAYHSQRRDEIPFQMGEGYGKFEFVNAIYPDGKLDIGVYSFRGDMTYSYEHFRRMFALDNYETAEERRVDPRILEFRQLMMQKDLKNAGYLSHLNKPRSKTKRNPMHPNPLSISQTNKKAASMTFRSR